MTHPAVSLRRHLLDDAYAALRVVLGALDSDHDALDKLPSFMPTTGEARALADAATDEADSVRSWAQHDDSRAAAVVRVLLGAVVARVRDVRVAADALDRAMRATSDDASTAADGASLVVSA